MPASANISEGRGIAEVIVPRPVEVVFDYVSDLRHMPTWWSTHHGYRRLLGSGGPGTLYAWTMPRGPIPFALPFGGLTVVTVLERSTRFGYRIVSPGLFTRMTYDFIGVPGGTRISVESSSVRPGFPEHVATALDTLATTLAIPSS